MAKDESLAIHSQTHVTCGHPRQWKCPYARDQRIFSCERSKPP